MKSGNGEFLFDMDESQKRKEEGMERAASKKPTSLEIIRVFCREFCKRNGIVTADDAGRYAEDCGIALGNAAGSLFKGGEFEFTGERIISVRKKNHGRELKVWRLKR